MAKRVRPARAYQRVDEPIRRLADLGRPRIAHDMLDALRGVKRMIKAAQMEHWLRGGAYFLVKEAVDWKQFREVLKGAFDRITQVREAGAALGVRRINGAFARRGRAVRFTKSGPAISDGAELGMSFSLDSLFDAAVLNKAIGERFNFDRYDVGTSERIRAAQDALIRQLTRDARDAIDGIVTAGVQAGLDPARIVEDIRELIGLTDTQARAVINYRSYLQTLDPAAIRRQLRNSALDDTIREAIESGQPLEDAFIERAVRDYEENFLSYRAQTIAHTESVRAASHGLQDVYRQAIERGALPDDAVRRHWQIALDERTCPVCLSIYDRNPNGVPVGQPFDSIEGPINEPPVHPRCRCSIDYVTDLDKVPDVEEEAA